MDTLLDEQETAVRDVARDVLSKEAPPELVRAMEKDLRGYLPELWAELSSLGWMGLSLPEEYGGQDLPLTYTALLLGEVGRHIAPVPLHSSVVAAQAIARFGTDEQKQRYLPGLIDGTRIGTFAFQERSGSIAPTGIKLRATADGDGFVLDGTKSFVDNFTVADFAVVALRTEDDEDPRQGIRLAVLDTKAAGISVTPLVTTAKDNQDLVSFSGVRVAAADLLGQPEDGWTAARWVLDLAVALLCAQLVGATRRDLEFAVEYSKVRYAFKQPIGSFQALQHLMADMLNATDASELLTYEAIWRLSADRPASIEVSQAKAFAGEQCLFVGRSAQQIHGGMSFMAEFDLQLWYRRIVAWSLRLGSSYEHRARIQSAILDGPGQIRLGSEIELIEALAGPRLPLFKARMEGRSV